MTSRWFWIEKTSIYLTLHFFWFQTLSSETLCNSPKFSVRSVLLMIKLISVNFEIFNSKVKQKSLKLLSFSLSLHWLLAVKLLWGVQQKFRTSSIEPLTENLKELNLKFKTLSECVPCWGFLSEEHLHCKSKYFLEPPQDRRAGQFLKKISNLSLRPRGHTWNGMTAV